MQEKLIDVSQHQGNINWQKVKASGINYAILRLGWIGNNKQELDTKFEQNYQNARANGVNVGVYVYNYAKSEQKIIEGANWTAQKLKDKNLQLPVYIDMEDDSLTSLGKKTLTDFCITFNSITEKNGRWAGVYANKNWFTNYLDYNSLKSKYTLWLAQYSSQKSLECDIWQYSEKGRVDGISDNQVDMNWLYRDMVSEITGGGSVPTPQPQPKPQEGSDEKVRKYINGSTPEPTYSNWQCTNKIGSLSPHEECDCFGEFNGKAMVRYKVDGKDDYKIAFCKWLGGIK